MNELANNIEDKINNVICVTRFNDETYAQFEEHLNERIICIDDDHDSLRTNSQKFFLHMNRDSPYYS